VSVGLSIRRAQAADASLIVDFIKALAGYERLAHEVDAGVDNITAALFAPQPRVFCDIASWDGVPAGFAVWFYNFSTFRGQHGIYLEDLFVLPALRGRGIGKALLVQLAQRAVCEGCARVEWSVLDWNQPAIDFYLSMGAVPMKDWSVLRLTGDALARIGRS
jgi:GNAT superfamily N-acetyltransferase